MNYNHPLWEGHKFNGYKQDPKHYNTSNEEKVRIRSAHSQKERQRKVLNEDCFYEET